MNDFIFKSPTKVLFGVEKALELPKVLELFQSRNILIITGKIIEKTEGFLAIIDRLKAVGVTYTIYAETLKEPTVEFIDATASFARQHNFDAIVSIGGGSPIDTAKAVAMLITNEGTAKDYMFGGGRVVTHPPVPVICIPTTAGSGAEVTASCVISDEENQIKASITHELMIPKIAIIDPKLHVSMPFSVTASTGMDALTHAIESYTSLDANPMSEMYGERAIELIGANIRIAAAEPNNLEARSNMAIASVLAAIAFLNGGLGAVHGISQAIGGIAHVPHGVGNALLLPYVLEINIAGNPRKYAKIAALLGEKTDGMTEIEAAQRAVHVVRKLITDLSIPQELRQLGVEKNMFERIIDEAMAYRLLRQNPVEITPEIVSEILEKAF